MLIRSIVNEIYKKYLNLADKKHIIFDLDFPDPTQKITNPTTLKQDLNQILNLLFSQPDLKSINLIIKKEQIVIKANILLPKKLFLPNFNFSSRFGFGTKVILPLS